MPFSIEQKRACAADRKRQQNEIDSTLHRLRGVDFILIQDELKSRGLSIYWGTLKARAAKIGALPSRI